MSEDFTLSVRDALPVRDRASSKNFQITFEANSIPPATCLVGRDRELETLKNSVLAAHKQSKRRKVVVWGAIGTGKTHLAAYFVRNFFQRFSAVIWLDGRSKASLESGLVEFARVHLPTRPQSMYSTFSWLNSEGNGEWLLVVDGILFDDCDEEGYKLETYLPTSNNGTIIITSCLAPPGWRDPTIRLKNLDNENSDKVLITSLESSTHNDARKKLVEKLGGCPLALAQASSYITKTRCTLSDYSELYTRGWTELVTSGTPNTAPLLDQADKTLCVTWIVSLNKMISAYPEAHSLLKVWSFLSPCDFFPSLLNPPQDYNAEEPRPVWLSHLHNKDDFTNLMETLKSYSLVEKKNNEQGYSMHPAAHAMMKELVRKGPDFESASLACRLVAENVPRGDIAYPQSAHHRLRPHVGRLYSWLRHECGARTIDICPEFLHELACFYKEYRDFEKARYIYNINIANGLKHPLNFLTALNVADMYRLDGQYEDAKNELEKVFAHRERAMENPQGVDVFHNAYTMGKDIATVQNQFDTALDYAEKAYQLYVQKFGRDSMSTSLSLRQVAIAEKLCGNKERYESLLLECLEQYRRFVGNMNPATAWVLFNLAEYYESQNALDKAEEYYRLLFESQVESFKADFVYKGDLQPLHLAIFLVRNGRESEAVQICEQVLAEHQTYLRKSAIEFQIYNALAVAHMKARQTEKSRSAFKAALECVQASFNPVGMEVAMIKNNLGTTYSQDDPATALALYEEAHSIHKSLGTTSSGNAGLDNLQNLVARYRMQNRFAEAEKLSTEAIVGYRKLHGFEADSTRMIIVKHISLLDDAGDFDRALSVNAAFIDEHAAVFGAMHINTLCVHVQRAAMLKHRSYHKESSQINSWLVSTLKTSETRESRILYAQAQYNLALDLEDLGDMEGGIAAYRESLALREELLEPQHPYIADTIWNLGMALARIGAFEESVELLSRGLGMLQDSEDSERGKRKREYFDKVKTMRDASRTKHSSETETGADERTEGNVEGGTNAEVGIGSETVA